MGIAGRAVVVYIAPLRVAPRLVRRIMRAYPIMRENAKQLLAVLLVVVVAVAPIVGASPLCASLAEVRPFPIAVLFVVTVVAVVTVIWAALVAVVENVAAVFRADARPLLLAVAALVRLPVYLFPKSKFLFPRLFRLRVVGLIARGLVFVVGLVRQPLVLLFVTVMQYGIGVYFDPYCAAWPNAYIDYNVGPIMVVAVVVFGLWYVGLLEPVRGKEVAELDGKVGRRVTVVLVFLVGVGRGVARDKFSLVPFVIVTAVAIAASVWYLVGQR